MADLYTRMASTAARLITKYGGSITLVRETGGSFNAVTGATVAGSDASVTTTGVLKMFPDSMIDGSRILASDRMVIIDNTQEPQPSDKVTVLGENWSIVDIKTVKPNGATAVIYYLHVRK